MNDITLQRSLIFVSTPSEITKILIKIIHSYKKHKITLADLIKLAEAIENNRNPFMDIRLKRIALEIRSFSIVADTLDDVLSELIEMEKSNNVRKVK